MRRYKQIASIGILMLPLVTCSKPPTEYHVTPTLSGQFVDSQTEQPIANVTVYLTDEYQTSSDSTGNFTLPAMVSYGVRKRNKDYFERIYQYADVMVEVDGYQRKLFNVDGLALPTPDFDMTTTAAIEMGKVYLTPLPEGEQVYGKVYEYIATMSYCKPNESQRQVDCLPVTSSQNSGQVSPN